VKTKITLLALLAGWAMNAQTIKATTSTYGTASTFGNNSVLVGTSAGNAASTGANNTFIGYWAGKVTSTSAGNTFVGSQTGAANTAANNTFIGYYAGKVNVTGTSNTFLGSEAGTATTTSNNTFIGFQAGKINSIGSNNTFIGVYSGMGNSNGSGNICIGYQTGYNIVSGINNVYIGNYSGMENEGNNNTFLGNNSGSESTGSNNVFIGTNVGFYESSNNKLMIDNQDISTPLIWGDFSADQLKLNGKTGIGMGTNTFPTSVGGASVTGYNLFVRGGILADEVRVRTTWSDYVFTKDYKLPTLEEVENHINQKGYLINVPSGKQVEEEGIELGQMAKIQQEKIEELTLYIIEQNKINKQQGEKIAKLETLVQTLLDKQ
jgi:hypothetical protein